MKIIKIFLFLGVMVFAALAVLFVTEAVNQSNEIETGGRWIMAVLILGFAAMIITMVLQVGQVADKKTIRKKGPGEL